jgi:hypothetical protein
MTAWTVVLIASLSMPILMHRLTLTIPAAAPPLRVIESIPALSSPLEVTHVPALPAQGPLALPPAAEAVVVHSPSQMMPAPVDRRSLGWRGFDWRALATATYVLVAGVLLRLLTGFLLTWRMVWAARPIHESWAGSTDVRVSDVVGVPVTFGSTVLLPTDYVDWSEAKRQAVLAHEGSHVAHGDFYVLLLATFNRAVFWFSPFAWWQLVRMTDLAEMISDDAALEVLGDRSSYAGILLDVARSYRRAPVAAAMARVCTVRKRVERILVGTAVPVRMGWRKRALVAIALAPVVMFSAGAVVPGGAPASDANTVEGEPHPFDRYVGYYEFAPFHAVTVARGGDRLTVQETGRLKVEVTAYGDQAFVSPDTNETIAFTSDTEGRASALSLGEPGRRARRAIRIDAARAQSIEDAFARQVATVPDRFKDQLPADGSKAALLREIHDLETYAPGDARLEQMAENVRGQVAPLHTMLAAFGEVESVFFRGVGPGGYDLYGAKFAGGLGEFRVRLGADGHIEDMGFRADGDDTPGEVLPCAREQTLQAAAATVPIQLLIYNASGIDIRAFVLDGDGKRSRESPVPGSEQALREYIDALGRGAPNYDDMTPQVAMNARQQLLLYRAVLARLGTLRAMSFRAVTAAGNDLYIAHFSNGSADWRIGLAKQGKIGRISLGPQFGPPY